MTLRNQAFTTLDELNAAIAEKVADYNAAPFQKCEDSRKLVFDEVELAFLMPAHLRANNQNQAKMRMAKREIEILPK